MKSKPFRLSIYAENDEQSNEGIWTCAHISADFIVDKVDGKYKYYMDGEELTEEQMKNKLYVNFTSIALTQYLKSN